MIPANRSSAKSSQRSSGQGGSATDAETNNTEADSYGSTIEPVSNDDIIKAVRGEDQASKKDQDIFYMKPSRFFPKTVPTQDIIDNLAYVMQGMSSKNERAQTKGIGFLANMNDWTFDNFSIDYCAQFMAMLQDQIPVKVELFLICNPPSWFPIIWRIMKPMLSRNFRRKVHMINESKLSKFLEKGYEKFLPDEMESGLCDTNHIVRDFVSYRTVVEDLDVSRRYQE